MSPSKGQFWTELIEANAKLVNSEKEAQQVKALMFQKCRSTIGMYTQQFRVAAGQFQALSHEIFQSEQDLSKASFEQKVNEMASMLETQAMTHEEQNMQFKQYVENLENHANSEFAMFKQAAIVREEHALAEQDNFMRSREPEQRSEDVQQFRTEASMVLQQAAQSKDEQITLLESQMRELQARQRSFFFLADGRPIAPL